MELHFIDNNNNDNDNNNNTTTNDFFKNEKNFINKFLNKLKFTIYDLLINNDNKLLTIQLHNTKISDHM